MRLLPPPSAPPGWYPDPLERHEVRYWDGGSWTSHVADSGVANLDDLLSVSPEPANTSEAWARAGEWREWPAPANAVRGESFHQKAFVKLAGPIKDGEQYYKPVEVVLSREPQNPHDANAIIATVDGHMVGHVARELAQQLAPLVDRMGINDWILAGVIVGGCVDAPTFGLHLWLDRRRTPGPAL